MENSILKSLCESLEQSFGAGSEIVLASAPGRVNLIGEHTDYNDGFVLPMAIPFSVNLAVRRRSDRQVGLFSVDFGQRVMVDGKGPIRPNEHRWANYPLGVIWALQEIGVDLPGIDLAIQGNVPQGAGLSSSAALEVATAVALRRLEGLEIENQDLARLCQRAENDFVGMNCGIMDQFISLMGREGYGLFLDCRSLEYTHVPLGLNDYRILICHSGVKHSLVDSEYNKRRKECETGVTALQALLPGIKALRDVGLDDLTAWEGRLDPVVFRRCRHVITENQRVLQSVTALKTGDLSSFGMLMNASHDSLRDDYEVSCAEIDLLIDLARQQPGLLGARMTGGGFGGCIVNLVLNSAIEAFVDEVGTLYREQTGITPRFYVGMAVEGAHIIEEE